MLPDSIIKIINAGGNVVVSADGTIVDNLEQYANAAKAAGTTVTIRKANIILLDSAIKIARAGAGKVIFDFAS